MNSLKILNPKKITDKPGGEESQVYSYYAGYSSSFAEELLASLRLRDSDVVLDPWNGAGTTTSAANFRYRSYGYDLNPVMVLIAKASIFSTEEIPSVRPLAKIVTDRAWNEAVECKSGDPLLAWLAPNSASLIRSIEQSIKKVFIDDIDQRTGLFDSSLNHATPLASFFYVALFRTARKLLKKFTPSNPTWVRVPKNTSGRLRPSIIHIEQTFLSEVEKLAKALIASKPKTTRGAIAPTIEVGDATSLQLSDQSVDCVLTSPPYCTRIDYAVATSIEMAVLGMERESYDKIRRALMGTSTVPKAMPTEAAGWGKTCLKFLDSVRTHKSKASSTYYLKSHIAYYSSLYNSVLEISRVAKNKARCFMVVQDSHYKDVHNDLQTILIEMMDSSGLACTGRYDFEIKASMSNLNSRAKVHLKNRINTESVICFQK